MQKKRFIITENRMFCLKENVQQKKIIFLSNSLIPVKERCIENLFLILFKNFETYE